MIKFWATTACELAALGALVYGVARISVTAAIILGASIALAGVVVFEIRQPGS